jgi:hypothetical protein
MAKIAMSIELMFYHYCMPEQADKREEDVKDFGGRRFWFLQLLPLQSARQGS